MAASPPGGSTVLSIRRAVVLPAVAVGLAACVWLAAPWMAGLGLRYAALEAGLQEPHFSVSHLGLREARMEEAHFVLSTEGGSLGLDAAQVRLDYTWSGSRAVLHGVAMKQAKLVWQSLPAERSDESRAAADGSSLVLPFERLTVDRLEVQATTVLGRSVFSGRAEIVVPPTGGLDARFRDSGQTFRLSVAPSGAEARLLGESADGTALFRGEATRQQSGAFRATLDADGKSLVEWLATSGVLPDQIRTRVAGLPELRQGMGRLGPQLALTLETESGAAPLRLEGRLLHEGQAVAALQALKDPGGVTADLRLNASLAVLSSLLVPWLPPRAVPWVPQAGAVRGRADLRRTGGAWTGTAYLEGDGLALTRGALAFTDGRLRLNVSDFGGHAAEFQGEVPSVRLGEKLEAQHLSVRGSYRPGRLNLQEAGVRLFGGNLDLVPVELDLEQRPYALTLRLSDIDLEPLLRSLEQKDLSGAGRVGGELPLRIGADGPAIEGGTLAGKGAGVLRYRGPAADPGNIAFKALRNLAYHSLKAGLDYRPDGEYRIGLRLEGRNPELLEGYPLAFNLNLSGQLSELMRAGLLSGDWDRSILEQAEKQRREGAH